MSKPEMKELKQEYWSRVKMGETSARKEVGECFQWKATGQCSRGDSCSFNHGSHSGQRAQSSSSTSRAPTQTDGRKLYKYGNLTGESPSCLKPENRVKIILRGTRTEPSCDFWHPPICLNHKSDSRCKYGDKCKILHTEAGGQSRKKVKER